MNARLSRLVELLQQQQIDALVLNPGPNFTYLTGLQMHLMERPTVLFITSFGQAALVLPYLEKENWQGLSLSCKPSLMRMTLPPGEELSGRQLRH